MTRDELRCPPTSHMRSECAPQTILEHAAAASDAANYYRTVMDDRADFRTTINAAAALARATHALTTAIADAVATGDNLLS